MIPKHLAPRTKAAYEQRIPMIIWQTMKTNLVPKIISESANSWIEKNPEYEYRFFDDKDIFEFVKSEFPEYLRAFKKIKHGAVKADLWRYLVIYKHGGVYADIDSKCVVSMREWVQPSSHWVTHLGTNRDVCQWLLMSVPNNPIFKLAAVKGYENIVRGRPPYIQFEGFRLGSDQKIRICEGSRLRTSHPIMTLAGPPILQQAAEECLINKSAKSIFEFTQVVCVSDQTQCEMNGNVSHDCAKDEYLQALIDMSTPHYGNSKAQSDFLAYLYTGIVRRIKKVFSNIIP
jgi:mannosyltransferase OCH1-like enzyme